MLPIPSSLLDLLNLQVGSKVEITTGDGALIIKPISKPKYTLEELISTCNPKIKTSIQDRDWVNASRLGNEYL